MLRAVLVALVALASAPAIDFVHPSLVPPEYYAAVRRIERLAVCLPSPDRPLRRSPAEHSGLHGSLLVRPLHERRVPIEHDYEQHYILASQLPWSDHSPGPEHLPQESLCAIDFAVRKGGALVAWRDVQRSNLTDVANSLRPFSDRLNAQYMPEHVFFIAGKVNTAFIAALTDGLGYRDRTIAHGFLLGFPAIGTIPDSRAYRPLPPVSPAAVAEFHATYDDILATNENWNARVARRTRIQYHLASPAQRALNNAVEEKTLKEESKGLVRRVGSLADVRRKFGYGHARAMFSFGVPQKGSVRRIDNGASSRHNEATLTFETIVTPSFEYPAIVARAVAAAAFATNVAVPPLLLGLQDLAAAYRTVPTSQPQYCLFAVYVRSAEDTVFFYTPGFPFGLVSAVVTFNRFAEFMAVASRCVHALPVDHFFDDNILVDVAYGGDSGERAFLSLYTDIGDVDPVATGRARSPGIAADKAQPMAPVNKALGVMADLSTTHATGEILFTPTPDRVREILQMWHDASVAGVMSPHLASRLRGKIGFLLQATYARVGRAATQVLVQREYYDGKEESFTGEMRHAHAFFKALLPHLPPKVVTVAPDLSRPLLLYTDAMFRPKRSREREECSADSSPASKFVTGLGLVLYDPADGAVLYGAHEPTLAELAHALNLDAEAKTYIAQLEALAAIAAFRTFADRIRGRRVNFFIDNTVALSAFIHGYARKSDLARLTNVFHLQVAGLRASVYMEYVPSKANIADLPSRGEFDLLTKLGGTRVPVRTPSSSSWRGPLRRWLDI